MCILAPLPPPRSRLATQFENLLPGTGRGSFFPSFPLRHSSAARGVSTQTEASSIVLQVRPRPGGFLLPLDPGRPRPGPRPPPWAVTRGHHPTAAVQPVGRRQQLTLAFGVVLSPPSSQLGGDLTPDFGGKGETKASRAGWSQAWSPASRTWVSKRTSTPSREGPRDASLLLLWLTQQGWGLTFALLGG